VADSAIRNVRRRVDQREGDALQLATSIAMFLGTDDA
jgi:hypothetical protein